MKAEAEETVRFAEMAGTTPAADQERLNHLAYCIATQQVAGFGSYLDTREFHCADCKAPGFNTGWGYFSFACGLEIGSDAEEQKPCGAGVNT